MDVSSSDDERRYGTAADGPPTDPWWSEWWWLSWWSPDASIGGSVRLEVFPAQRRSWFWATLVGVDRLAVSVCDHEAPLPPPGSLELRASGLWTDLIVQTPERHMTVGLEAFGVAFDDPAEGFGRGWGDRTPLGLDLEWESVTEPIVGPDEVAIACVTHGEVLVGRERIDLDGLGWRTHGWGGPGAARFADATRGFDADGTPTTGSRPNAGTTGWVGAAAAGPDGAETLVRESLEAEQCSGWTGWARGASGGVRS